jgi:hypothetical protein
MEMSTENARVAQRRRHKMTEKRELELRVARNTREADAIEREFIELEHFYAGINKSRDGKSDK